MLEVLQFYVSGFWVWLGLTIGLGLFVKLIISLWAIAWGAMTGTAVKIH